MSSQPISFREIRTPAAARAEAAKAWPVEKVLELFNLPFNDLLFRAQQVHRENFDPQEVELATLLSINRRSGALSTRESEVTAEINTARFWKMSPAFVSVYIPASLWS